MVYEVIDITSGDHQQHWILLQPHLKEHNKIGHLQNIVVENAWCDKIEHHDWLYCVHIKSGHLGNHQHFTIIWQLKKGHVKIAEVHEGHKSIF